LDGSVPTLHSQPTGLSKLKHWLISPPAQSRTASTLSEGRRCRIPFRYRWRPTRRLRTNLVLEVLVAQLEAAEPDAGSALVFVSYDEVEMSGGVMVDVDRDGLLDLGVTFNAAEPLVGINFAGLGTYEFA